MKVPDNIKRIPFNYRKPDCPELSVGNILEAVVVEPTWRMDLIGRKIYFHVFKVYKGYPQLIQIYSPEDWEVGPAFLEIPVNSYLKWWPWEKDAPDERANLIQIEGNWPLDTRSMRIFLLEDYKQPENNPMIQSCGAYLDPEQFN
jgi:hypothetical protein